MCVYSVREDLKELNRNRNNFEYGLVSHNLGRNLMLNFCLILPEWRGLDTSEHMSCIPTSSKGLNNSYCFEWAVPNLCPLHFLLPMQQAPNVFN